MMIRLLVFVVLVTVTYHKTEARSRSPHRPPHDHGCGVNEWTRFRQSCYYISAGVMNIDDAMVECQEQGGALVSIQSPIENYWIAEKLNRLSKVDNRFFWTSGFTAADKVKDNTYYWIWGDYTEVGYTNWAPGEPNDKGYVCLAVNRWNGKWSDEKCHEKFNVVCEKKVDQ
ncbi:perlucin-like protein [Mytilus galloprovincialis]|uniref:perlucin-like protein n=1 Tax=Mytilus galloprovincialis TaxID=29158 RepID=UPI003F7BA630